MSGVPVLAKDYSEILSVEDLYDARVPLVMIDLYNLFYPEGLTRETILNLEGGFFGLLFWIKKAALYTGRYKIMLDSDLTSMDVVRTQVRRGKWLFTSQEIVLGRKRTIGSVSTTIVSPEKGITDTVTENLEEGILGVGRVIGKSDKVYHGYTYDMDTEQLLNSTFNDITYYYEYYIDGSLMRIRTAVNDDSSAFQFVFRWDGLDCDIFYCPEGSYELKPFVLNVNGGEVALETGSSRHILVKHGKTNDLINKLLSPV